MTGFETVTTMVSAHPTSAMLSAYAAGSATDGVSLLVAAHLTYCPACRAAVRELEALSGALFAAGPEASQGPSLDAVLARIDRGGGDPIRAEAPAQRGGESGFGGRAAGAAIMATGSAPVLPRPIAAALGRPFEAIKWRFRMPGVSECPIDCGEGEKVSLLRVRPGAGVPSHTHTAEEATLVLAGALCDRGATYVPGDVSVATADDDHHPRAGLGEDCICLAVLSGGLRFTGAFGRALNIFAE
jgi:putative transcriptional regulator